MSFGYYSQLIYFLFSSSHISERFPFNSLDPPGSRPPNCKLQPYCLFILFLGAWFWHHTPSSPGMPSLTLYFSGRINRSIFCVLFVRFSYDNPLQTWLQSSCIGVPISFQVWALRAGTILASSTQLAFPSKLKQTVWTQYLLFKESLFVQAHLELYTFLKATAELIREWNILLWLSSHLSGSFCDGLAPGHGQWAS